MDFKNPNTMTNIKGGITSFIPGSSTQFYSVCSSTDGLVSQQSAFLQGATNIVIPGISSGINEHLGFPTYGSVISTVLDILSY